MIGQPIMDFPQPEMIEVNGVDLEVFSVGAGKPIVLCHGWPEHAYSWRHQIEPLVNAGYHVIAPNQRGYGHSTKPAAVTDYDIQHLTGDLLGLLDHFGYEDACFVGHDCGAIIVWNLAMMHRQRVSHLINISRDRKKVIAKKLILKILRIISELNNNRAILEFF